MTLSGEHYGNTVNVWTYYGEIKYSYSELIVLKDKEGNEIERISEMESDGPTIVENPADWVVSLIERVSWNENSTDVERVMTLYIFCPISSE